MNTLWVVPLEPLEERYTKQWYDWIPKDLDRMGVQYEIIDGTPLTSKIETGKFLDVFGTNYYKSSQIMEISKLFREGKIKEGDRFFFADLYFPGIEAVKYMSQLSKIKVSIYGVLHAASYDRWDFLAQAGVGYWSADYEEALLALADGVFVATEFHKKMILENRNTIRNNIYVTGLPLKFDEILTEERKHIKKERICVFPHRLDKEKQPHIFDKVTEALLELDPSIKCIKTAEVFENKKQYYDLLAKSQVSVSFALQETWGIANLESMILGCVPILPNRLSYPEIVCNDSRLLYSYPEEFAGDAIVEDVSKRIIHFMNKPINVSHYAKRFDDSMDRIISTIDWIEKGGK